MNDDIVTEENAVEILPHQRFLWKYIGTVCVALIVVLFGVIGYGNIPPHTFATGSEFMVNEGSSIRTIGDTLKEQGFIHSSFLFRLIVRGSSEPVIVRAGSYTFTKPLSTRALIDALADGTTVTPSRSVTFPEGFSVYDMRTYVGDAILTIDTESALQYEGYLFPDTYFVSPHETFDTLVTRMRVEYDEKIAPFRERIEASGFTEKEVIILASIIEREANDETSMRMVSGILQNRLQNDLPLQVDAIFAYLLGKTSVELTMDDLALDSPYNTYTNIGLPPTPIANPGLMSINAVLDPFASEYLFYLTGADGTFYYAKDFEEHKRNKARHLRS
jgi:UPF0755 protein